MGGELKVEPQPLPQPGQGEARIRVALAGVCNTDLEIVRGYMGFEGTLGHELVGVVDACSDPAWVGRRVCADINVACDVCAVCRAGDPHHCPNRTVVGIVGRDGAFADALVVPIRNLVPVPENVSDDAAVFAEPLAAAFEILEQVAVGPDTSVLVLGDGKLGLLCAMALRTTGCALTTVGRHESKLALLEGIETTTELAADTRFDVVVEATGSSEGLAAALDHVRARGTLVLKSTFAGRPQVDTNRIVVDEIRLVGSRCGPMPRALQAMADGVIDPRPLIHHRRNLDEGVEAIALAQQRGVLKVLLSIRP